MQLARHNKELSMMLKPGGASGGEGDEALECYANHTAQIEVRGDTHTQPCHKVEFQHHEFIFLGFRNVF